ncbi:hypothetical protein GW17_00026152 [Ensete ventricosum]|nr:hypothetical protein GW17_00026152 [Ensete ventricosum]
MPWYQVRGGVGGGGRGGGEVEELEKKKKWRRRRVLSPWQCTAGTAGKGRQHERELIMFRRRIPCLDSYLDKLDLNLERLRMAVDDLLVKLAKAFAKPKSQTVFLINNYDMTIAILKVRKNIWLWFLIHVINQLSYNLLWSMCLLDGFGKIDVQEAGTGGGKLQEHFEELLKSNIGVYVEELLLEHFGDLIRFVKSNACELGDKILNSKYNEFHYNLNCLFY